MKPILLSGTTRASRKLHATNSQKEVQPQPAAGGTKPPASGGDAGHASSAHIGKPVSRRLHRKQAAVYVGVSLSWLDKSRLRGDGPTFLEIGGRVVYDTADLDAFLSSCRRTSTSRPP